MPFIILTFFAAFLLEALGSLVSIIGISALFGANWIIIALAVILDLGKVVTVSMLYRNWNILSFTMKAYAILACTITMIITSAGAAGYLTGEFQKAIMGSQEGETKIAMITEQQTKYTLRKKQIDDQISALPEKTSVSQRLRLMKGFQEEKTMLDNKIMEIDNQLPELKLKQISTEAKSGPIISIAKMFNIPVETAVSYVIGLIIVVFDPLAIFLIIAGNFLLKQHKKPVVQEIKTIEVVAPEVPATPKVDTVEIPVKVKAVRKPRAVKPKRIEAVTRDLFGYEPSKPKSKAKSVKAPAQPLPISQLTSIAADIDTITNG